MQTRRDFIKRAAMLTGAAGFAAGVPESVQKAFAIEPIPGTTWADAEHVVILMQENRSFDHALGSLQGVRGFNDPRAIRQANGNSIFLQTNAAGDTFAPWRLDIKDTKITWMGSIPHVRHSQVDAWNQGHFNNWIEAKRSHNPDYVDVPITMGHYTREDLPFYYALADAFTVCDQHYCGVMSSTTPNRSVFWTGTIRDQQSTNSAVYIRNPEFAGSRLKWTTFPERLSEAGVDWKFYQNELGFADLDPDAREWLNNLGNMLEAFAVYHTHMSNADPAQLQSSLEAAKAELAQLEQMPAPRGMKEDHVAELKGKRAYIRSLESQLKAGGKLADLPKDQQDLHMRAFVTNVGDKDYHSLETISFEEDGKTAHMAVPKGDIFYQFRKDVNEGKLPTISWLSPPGKFSDHPAHPWYGAWYVSEVVDILTKNPELWKKTIFILTYDENDGYFDHCPSFVAADPHNKSTGRGSEGIDTGLEYTYASDEIAQGVSKEEARSGPIGLGFRVPMIIASPWSRGGWVNSEVFDHTSTLQFLEEYVQTKYGKTVRETNISPFRRAICGNLLSNFRSAESARDATLPFLNRDHYVESIQRARSKEIPSNYSKLTPEQIASYNQNPRSLPNASRQEPGIRPACALPYELYCEGDFSAEHKAFGLAMRAGNSVHGRKSAGAPFNVYLRNTAKSSGAIPRGNNNQNMFVATFAVAPGDTLQEAFPQQVFANGRYEIDVHGPNGFYRAFRGDTAAPSPVSVRCVYLRESTGLTGDVEAIIQNVSGKTVTVEVTDNSYKTGAQSREVGAGQRVSLPITASKVHGWYDFTVQAKGSTASVRYAGRVETGAPSFTDPVMGEAI